MSAKQKTSKDQPIRQKQEMVDFRGEPFEEPGHQDFVTEEIHPVAENREHTNSVDALSANPTNRAIYASGSHDYNIKLWDGNSG